MQKYDISKHDYTRSLLFTWPTGVGKTYTAKKLLDKFNDDPNDKLATYHVSDAKFKQMVKSNLLFLRKPTDRQCSLMSYPLEVMTRCKLLLYDDVWVSDVTEAYLRDLTYILDERIEKKLTTIFTTNLSKKELEAKLNQRILSRLLFNTDVVVFKWEDRREATTRMYEI